METSGPQNNYETMDLPTPEFQIPPAEADTQCPTECDEGLYSISEKAGLLVRGPNDRKWLRSKLPRKFPSRQRSQLQVLVFLALSVLTISYLRNHFHRDAENERHDDFHPSNIVEKGFAATTSSTASIVTPTLEVFQVYQPVFLPEGVVDDMTSSTGTENTTSISTVNTTAACSLVLMDYSFGYSYGEPFVGNYTPPSCSFNRVVMNFTVTSKGRQFDRLALMYFGDTEVWRTSTAEPTAYGIEWTYIKDMTEYLYFWNKPQTLIFDLGNLIDSTYTGHFNTTLTATFFTSQDTVDPAALILPISARKGNESAVSLFTLPADNATNTISFPQNANRAVFSISACGQSTEEFWWGNALQSDVSTFADDDVGTLYGYSPFREVQLYIDGQLAGVQWPFPVIFTGGVVPGLWRPIVGIDAFDLKETEIDITPWLGVLCDGSDHKFEIKVAGLLDDGNVTATITETVGSSWYVTGKIFIWLDDEGSITTGEYPSALLPAPTITVSQHLTQNSTGANQTLGYYTGVKRTLSISSAIKSQNGTNYAGWTQSLGFAQDASFTDQGDVQVVNQTTTGMDQSTGNFYYKASYTYPAYVNSTYFVDPSGSGNFTLGAVVDYGKTLQIDGNSVFPTGLQSFAHLPATASLVDGYSGTLLTTRENGTATYLGSSTGVASGFGSTQQSFKFVGISDSDSALNKELYYRFVEAVNATVVEDHEYLAGAEISDYSYAVSAVGGGYLSQGTAVMNPRVALGRGPGSLAGSVDYSL